MSLAGDEPLASALPAARSRATRRGAGGAPRWSRASRAPRTPADWEARHSEAACSAPSNAARGPSSRRPPSAPSARSGGGKTGVTGAAAAGAAAADAERRMCGRRARFRQAGCCNCCSASQASSSSRQTGTGRRRAAASCQVLTWHGGPRRGTHQRAVLRGWCVCIVERCCVRRALRCATRAGGAARRPAARDARAAAESLLRVDRCELCRLRCAARRRRAARTKPAHAPGLTARAAGARPPPMRRRRQARLSLSGNDGVDPAASPSRPRTSIRIVPGGAHDTWSGFGDTPTSGSTKFHASFRTMGVKVRARGPWRARPGGQTASGRATPETAHQRGWSARASLKRPT